MLKSYSFWVRERATTRTILGSLAAFVIVEGILAGFLLPRFRDITGGRRIPDSKVGYSYAEIYATVDGYGPEGIRFYRYIEAVDLLFPLVDGFLLTLLTARLLIKLNAGGRAQFLLFLPLVAVTFDYLENVGIFLMLWRHPGDYALIAALTNALTILKFAGIVLSVLVILGASVLLLYRRAA